MTNVHQDNEDSGAKKSIVLFAAQQVEENHSNLALAISEINLDQIDYKMSMDLKCSNIVNGLQTHSSRHPCVYGHCKKLKNGLWEEGEMRTVEEINKINKSWIEETNADPSKLKTFFNCKNANIIKENGTGVTKVLEMCPPPPLHTAKLGPTNDLMNLLEKVCPEEVKKFLIENHITKEGYHGGELEGGQCDKVMLNIDKLESKIPDEHKSIIDAFKATKYLNKCVSGKVLDENWKESVDKFEESISFLHGKYGLSLTPKLHILITHVPQYIMLTGKPLGYISDQTVDMAHQLVNRRMERSNYYVKSLTNENHGKNLLKGILHVNTYNI